MTSIDLIGDPIRKLAEHVATPREGLPLATIAAAKTFILDTIGVGIAGSGEPWASRLVETAGRWGTGDEGTVWGTRHRLPAPVAALVNAYQIHCQEFDCLHDAAVVHPMATLLATAMAWSERRGGVTGRQLLAATVLGVDVAASLGVAARGAMQFFRPAIAGAFGAVAACGALAGLDAGRLAHAFGIVYGHVSGTLQPHVEGLPLLGMQMGFNARGALTAVDLATAGFEGPRGVLEGRYGYFTLFEAGAYDLPPVLAELGRTWRITEVAHKPFPSGRLTHGVVDGLLALQAAHGFVAADVRRVRAAVPRLVHRLVGRPAVPTAAANEARLSLPFVAATALRRGGVDVTDFRSERLGDPDTHALAQRIEIARDDNPDENAMVPVTIEVDMVDGRKYESKVDRVLGSPARPLTREQHLGKFRRCWRYGASPLNDDAREGIIALVDDLESVRDVRELARLTMP